MLRLWTYGLRRDERHRKPWTRETFRPSVDGLEPRELPAVRSLPAIVHVAAKPAIQIIAEPPAGWVSDYYTFDHGIPGEPPAGPVRAGWHWDHRRLTPFWVAGPDGWDSRVTVFESAWTLVRGPGGSTLREKFPQAWQVPLNFNLVPMPYLPIDEALAKKLY